jgi:hypothetical protein
MTGVDAWARGVAHPSTPTALHSLLGMLESLVGPLDCYEVLGMLLGLLDSLVGLL